MKRFKNYKLRSQLIVFLGIVAAFVIDLAVKRGADYWGWADQLTPGPMVYAGAAIGFGLLAISLEGYVKPLSRTGALMTGFCGYAVLVLLLP